MAVGDYSLNGLTVGLSERLGATGWVPEPVPSPAHGANIFANEVSCASPSSCLFVGDHWAGKSGPSANLAEFWNGTSWRIVTAPAPVKSTFNGIDDVACPTTKFCLAVGQSGGTHTFQDRAYTWTDGKTWRRIAVPKPSGARNSELGALSCSDARACMATGVYENRSGHDVPFAARWHNGRWRLLATPTVRAQRETVFQTVSCPTATLCVAAGMTVDEHARPVLPRVRRGLERRQVAPLDPAQAAVAVLRHLLPGPEPLLRVRVHVPVADGILAPADRDLERPDLVDAAGCVDRGPAFRRRATSCVVRQPLGLRGRRLPVQAEDLEYHSDDRGEVERPALDAADHGQPLVPAADQSAWKFRGRK